MAKRLHLFFKVSDAVTDSVFMTAESVHYGK